MQNMIKSLFTPRRQILSVSDRRNGRPARRRPDPMPRMRWYS
jgi:hypothetical protein